MLLIPLVGMAYRAMQIRCLRKPILEKHNAPESLPQWLRALARQPAFNFSVGLELSDRRMIFASAWYLDTSLDVFKREDVVDFKQLAQQQKYSAQP